MNERDAKIARAKIDVQIAVIKMQAAKEKMDAGAQEARLVCDAKISMLKAEWLVAQQEVESEKVYLQEAEQVIGGSH